ncbi:hypothetical protein A2U01_0000475 [Trifolium medium]|uniref:Uncharacterized protein n=1 Tax=Trifolium medium TaxID=97028 RepID=A0A392LXP7_9FABA|nr:hypothetical protein [Trifolium medium]
MLFREYYLPLFYFVFYRSQFAAENKTTSDSICTPTWRHLPLLPIVGRTNNPSSQAQGSQGLVRFSSLLINPGINLIPSTLGKGGSGINNRSRLSTGSDIGN